MTNSMIHFTNNENTVDLWLACPEENALAIAEKFKKLSNETISAKIYEVGSVPFEDLPEAVKDDIKNILKTYHTVYVHFECGHFHTGAWYGIKASYPADYFVVGEYKDTEIYTLEERRQNYIEVFG